VLLWGALCGMLPAAQAQGVTLRQAVVDVQDDAVYLNAAVEFELTPLLEDALHKGSALYFVADVTVTQARWYWFDRKFAEADRTVRIAFEPLLRRYRVSTGGLNQGVDTLAEALALAQRGIRLRLGERSAFKPDERYEAELSYRLDVSKLPRLFQIGATQREFQLSMEPRKISFRVPPPAAPQPAAGEAK
jgi:hypothetical protein